MITYANQAVQARITHPALLLGAGVGLIVDVYYFALRSPHSMPEVAAFVVYALLCMAIPWFPRVAGCGMIVWYLLCAILPPLDAGFMLAGICVAFATVFAFMNTPVDLILIGTSMLTLYLTSTVDTAIAMTIMHAVSALAGYTIKRHMDAVRQREQLADARRTVAVMSRDMALATRLHDTVTNDLSYVITVASTRNLDTIDREERRTLDAIIERSQHAFAKTHEVIDVLSGKAREPDPSHTPVSLRRELEAVARVAQDRLRLLGLAGNVTVTGADAPEPIRPDVHEEIMGLVSEVFANLRRHCAPPADYTVIIRVQNDAFTLTALNTMSPKSTATSPTSGKGLLLHQSIIESIGGELTFHADHGSWTLRAQLPFAPPS